MPAKKKKPTKPKKTKTTSKLPALELVQRAIAAISIIIIIVSIPYPSFSKGENHAVSTTKKIPMDLPVAPRIPIKQQVATTPQITAEAAYVLDLNSSTPLYKRNENRRLMPASTTKIMTAIIALENYPLDKVITITQEDASIGQTMKLVRGEQISVESLLYGTLVGSGNDAALALALAYPQTGYSGFVNAMNAKAQELHLSNTHFSNVSGVETPEHYSSAVDLARLAKYALSNPTFKQMASTKSITLSDTLGKTKHYLTNTNQLLNQVDGMYGVKTGWTENAGECLITAVERDGNHIITVVLNSQNRFQDSAVLIDWIFNSFNWEEPKLL